MPKKAWGADLYLIQAGELTKLGRSQHPQKRLQEIQRGVPWLRCHLYAIFPKCGFLEASLHRQIWGLFDRHGEWYLASPNQVAEVVLKQLAELELLPA